MKHLMQSISYAAHMSSPSRGTWIETKKPYTSLSVQSSRPPHGGRGLKLPVHAGIHHDRRSSPSRGTWIETTRETRERTAAGVVPLTGDVD